MNPPAFSSSPLLSACFFVRQIALILAGRSAATLPDPLQPHPRCRIRAAAFDVPDTDSRIWCTADVLVRAVLHAFWAAIPGSKSMRAGVYLSHQRVSLDDTQRGENIPAVMGTLIVRNGLGWNWAFKREIGEK